MWEAMPKQSYLALKVKAEAKKAAQAKQEPMPKHIYLELKGTAEDSTMADKAEKKQAEDSTSSS
jgi:hypothetical protein